VVHAAVGARFLDSHDVVRLFHHANGPATARGPGAVETGIRVGDVVADGAFADFFFCVANGVGERQGVFGRRAQQKKSEALRGFCPMPGGASVHRSGVRQERRNQACRMCSIAAQLAQTRRTPFLFCAPQQEAGRLTQK